MEKTLQEYMVQFPGEDVCYVPEWDGLVGVYNYIEGDYYIPSVDLMLAAHRG